MGGQGDTVYIILFKLDVNLGFKNLIFKISEKSWHAEITWSRKLKQANIF